MQTNLCFAAKITFWLCLCLTLLASEAVALIALPVVVQAAAPTPVKKLKYIS